MHEIEPFYNWRDSYIASEDKCSPFYGTVPSEFEYSNAIYNYFIHPQWDGFGSNTLYTKALFVDYVNQFAILEFIGEWNDCINNDIMYLKRNIIDSMIKNDINKFILLGENVLNFHCSDDCYYEEWYDDIKDEGGWIAALNFREHVLEEMKSSNLNYYINWGYNLNNILWRKLKPTDLHTVVDNLIIKALA